MHLRTALPRFAAALTLLLGAATTAIATPTASADNNIEWSGVSHVTWQDCRPLCPVNGESFQVRFQTWGNDITSARVHLVVGASSSNITASKIGRRGPYDIWAATIPATAQSSENYWIELTDRTLTDYLSVNGLTHTTPVDGGFAVNFTTLSHAPVGGPPATGRGVLLAWAPTRTWCFARGTFNACGMTPPLPPQGEDSGGRATTVPARSQRDCARNHRAWEACDGWIVVLLLIRLPGTGGDGCSHPIVCPHS